MRHRRAIFVAGLVLLAASIAAGVVALTGGDGETGAARQRRGGARPRQGGIASLTETERPFRATSPSARAAVWVLSSGDRSVSRIDPETKEIVKTFKPGGVPSEIAAGEGAVWVGNAGGRAT